MFKELERMQISLRFENMLSSWQSGLSKPSKAISGLINAHILTVVNAVTLDNVPTMHSNRVIRIKYLWVHEIYFKLFKNSHEKMFSVTRNNKNNVKQNIVAMELSKWFGCLLSRAVNTPQVYPE